MRATPSPSSIPVGRRRRLRVRTGWRSTRTGTWSPPTTASAASSASPSRAGRRRRIISSFDGKRFNSPNDLTIRSDGTIYFTDPNFQAPSPTRSRTRASTWSRRASPTATELISTLSNPNGITLSLDEKTLYVGHGGGVYSYAVNTDGTIDTTATHVDASNLDNNATDGMAIDCAGDLYVVRVNTHDIDVVSFGGIARLARERT